MITLTPWSDDRGRKDEVQIPSMLASVAAGIAFTAAFLVDAIILPSHIKKLASIGAASGTLYFAIDGYLYYQSYKWNPLHSYGFEYSDINFKSIFTSSMINLSIFLMKPVSNDVT